MERMSIHGLIRIMLLRRTVCDLYFKFLMSVFFQAGGLFPANQKEAATGIYRFIGYGGDGHSRLNLIYCSLRTVCDLYFIFLMSVFFQAGG